MTTPAVNENFATPGIYSRKVKDPFGNLVISDSQISVASRYVRNRPASVNSLRRADGTRPPKNWDSSGGVFRQSRQYLKVTRFDGYTYEYDGLLFYPETLNLINSIPHEELASLAIRNALGHYGEASQKLGVALQEARKTGQLLGEYYRAAAKGVAKLSDALESEKHGALRRRMRDFASGWRRAPSEYVKYLYGVRPITDDIKTAVDVLTEYRHHGYEFRLTLRGKYMTKNERKEFVRPPANCTAQIVQQQSIFSKASLVFQLPSWYWDELPPVTPFSQLWETSSYSFLVDWALPIGNWVRGMEGFQLRPFFKEGSTTIFMRSAGTGIIVSPQVGYSVAHSDFSCQEDLWVMDRDAFFRFPSESVIRLPRVRSILQIGHLDDAAGLLGQRLAKLQRQLA